MILANQPPIDEPHVPGHLEGGDRSPAEVDQLLLGHLVEGALDQLTGGLHDAAVATLDLLRPERKLDLDPDWLELLDEYLEQYQPHDTLFTCTARNLEYTLTDVGEAVGLKQGLLSFENLRWISALQDWENDVEKDDIRQKLGLSKVTWRETKSKLAKLAAEREKE